MKKLPMGLALLAALSVQTLHADPALDRMRDQLRQTILQMRQLEDENLSLKAKAATAMPAPTPVAAKVDNAELNRWRSAAQSERERAAALQLKLDQATVQIQQLQQGLTQAGSAANSQQQAARTLEGQLKAALQQQQGCDSHNAELVSLATEILAKYRQQGFWQAVRDHEPVTGLYRVKLENLVQDYHNRIADATVAPAAAPEPVQPPL